MFCIYKADGNGRKGLGDYRERGNTHRRLRQNGETTRRRGGGGGGGGEVRHGVWTEMCRW